MRALGDHIDDTAGRTRAVENRGGAFQHFHLLQRVDVLPGRVVEAEQVLQIVAIFGRIEPAHLRKIATGGKAERFGRDAGRIGQRIVQRLGSFFFEILFRLDRNGPGRLDDRSIRFGGPEIGQPTRNDDRLLIGAVVGIASLGRLILGCNGRCGGKRENCRRYEEKRFQNELPE